MKNILTFLAITLAGTSANAQFYYNDLVTNRKTNQLYQQLRQQKIKKITIHSYEGQTTESAGFTAEQTLDASKRILRTQSTNEKMGNSLLEAQYNEQGWLIRTMDTVQNASNLASYTYDNEGRLTQLQTNSKSDNIVTTETHYWTYNTSGQPQKMLRVRNQSDTTTVQFTFDENGNLVEEKSVRKNLPVMIYYYYYDSKNRLTDIVRFNQKAQRLLPDYIFEYNENDQLVKMTMVPEGSNAYEQWFYQYLPNGLRRMELVYNKEQQLLGKVEYEYEQ